MRSHFFFLLLCSLNLVLPATGSAQTPATTVGIANCELCSTAQPFDKQLEQLNYFSQQIHQTLDCKSMTSEGCLLLTWLKQKHKEYAKSCQGFFVDDKGKLGPFSQTITNLIMNDVKENREQSVFVKPNPDFEKYCPGFEKMNLTQKVAFHTWIFELTAFPESSCNVNTKANTSGTPNGPAVCMYQLEAAPSLRAWRSSNFKIKHCAVSAKDILTLEGCTGCAFDEYKRHIVANGRPFGSLSEDGSKRINRSYWASQSLLPKPFLDCMEKNQELEKNQRPKWLRVCKGAIGEWMAPIKFFGRLPRFPLCGTPEAAKERAKLGM